ncbi:unnamed protein product [Prorocentrum cordatum]|uniref:RNase H type-1 domain-containing protein n=1 Tax=Prorocentrum cordatum TaxID=2364126 RepID=A0ABN9VFB0_9DINO|nr:unnamed protein product [Polarella glacialis]
MRRRPPWGLGATAGSAPGQPTPKAAAAPPCAHSAAAGLELATTLESVGFGGALGDALLAGVGGDADTSVSDFVSIQESDLAEMINQIGGLPASLITRGRAARAVRAVFGAAGIPPPDLGAPPPQVAVVEARDRHAQVTGGPPPANARPSAEQLSGLAARLRGKATPCVDFGAFGPYGRRQTKARKFEAQTFVDGRLETRVLTGPSNFEAWRSAWQVFRSCVISLGAAPPAALDAHEEGIRQLSVMRPSHWGVILRADDTVWSEKWDELLEEHLAGDPEGEQAWTQVLEASACGGQSRVSGAGGGGTPAVEKSTEMCNLWNNKPTGCRSPCTWGRKHVCRVRGGTQPGGAAAVRAEDADAAVALLARTASGRAHRHVLRGGAQTPAADAKRAEDAACQAGLRNPGVLRRARSGLWSTTAPIADLIATHRQRGPLLQGLAGACGATPTRQPPPAECLLPLRRALAGHPGIGAVASEQRHPASSRRPEIAREEQRRDGDPDSEIQEALLWPFGRSGLGHAAAAAGRLQLYVDDPVFTVGGRAGGSAIGDRPCSYLAAPLGAPLARKKGALYAREHRWVGATFMPRSSGKVHVMLPDEFLTNLSMLLGPVAAGSGHASLASARRVVGKCARVAYVAPGAAPFAAALWGAPAGAAAADREAPPGRVARRRFGAAARWMQALVDPSGLDLLPLRRVGSAHDDQQGRASDAVVKFDASPWGAGAALYRRGTPVEFFALEWSDDICGLFNVGTGDPRCQSFWEYLTVFLALCARGESFRTEVLTIAGDSAPALEGALTLRCKGLLNHITREIAQRLSRRQWEYVATHLPAEHNKTADALPRSAAPDRAAFPAEPAGATQASPPAAFDLFATTRAPPGRAP